MSEAKKPKPEIVPPWGSPPAGFTDLRGKVNKIDRELSAALKRDATIIENWRDDAKHTKDLLHVIQVQGQLVGENALDAVKAAEAVSDALPELRSKQDRTNSLLEHLIAQRDWRSTAEGLEISLSEQVDQSIRLSKEVDELKELLADMQLSSEHCHRLASDYNSKRYVAEREAKILGEGATFWRRWCLVSMALIPAVPAITLGLKALGWL